MVKTKSLGQKEEEPREMWAIIKNVHRDTSESTCDILSKGIKDDQIHMILEVVEPEEWKDQHFFLKDSKLVTSSLWKVVERFVEMGIISIDEVADAIDNIDIFLSIKDRIDSKPIFFTEKKYGKSKRLNWWPIRI